MVSGLYIQRKFGQHILEVYEKNDTGGCINISYEKIRGKELVEIESCGFGCVLINSRVIRSMSYPHFVYKSAINHADTISEDIYFCRKAKELGYKMYADPSIICEHIGSIKFTV
jgi:hypothetical protein